MNRVYEYPAIESRGYHFHPFWDVMTENERRKVCPAYLAGGLYGGMKEEIKSVGGVDRRLMLLDKKCLELSLKAERLQNAADAIGEKAQDLLYDILVERGFLSADERFDVDQSDRICVSSPTGKCLFNMYDENAWTDNHRCMICDRPEDTED